MFNFFNGRRRKAGCVTLLMAAVLTISWMRSNIVVDSVYVGSCSFGSARGGVFVIRDEYQVSAPLAWESAMDKEVTPEETAGMSLAQVLEWEFGTSEGITYDYAMYWWLVLPLTLLSAYLLLWPSRPKLPSPNEAIRT